MILKDSVTHLSLSTETNNLILRVMNTITRFLMIVVMGLTTHLSAQDTRLFYQTKEDLANYNFTVAERNGIPYFFAIKEVDGAYMKLSYGPLDVQSLSPIGYSYITLPVQMNHFQFLNGVNVVGDRLDLVVQSRTTETASMLNFIEIDLQSNTILASSSTPENYKVGFFRARSINQKLVLYGLDASTNQLVRFEKEITNNYTTDTVQETFNTYNAKVMMTEFEIVNNEEYVGVVAGINHVSFVKRNADDSYLITSPMLVSNFSVRSWDFIPFENNRFLFIGANKAIVLSSHLSVVSEENIDFLTSYVGLGLPLNAIVRNNELYIFGNSSLFKTDLSFNVIENHTFDRNVVPFDIVSIGNDTYMIGRTEDNVGYLNLQSSSLIINRNFDTSPIEEHHRTLTINDLTFNVGNYHRLFPHTMGATSSMTYGNEISSSPLIFESTDNLIGKNENDELVGIWGRYKVENPLLPGPLFTSVADSNLQRDKYNRSYYVTSQMISDHVAHHGNSGYGMPNGIRYWPANGNTTNGEAQKIADFIDMNENDIYEPHLGEFPKIYGDKCLLTVFHQSSSDTLGNELEVHRYLFSYDCDTNEVLKNTLFSNVRYINRGNDINDVYVGSFIDYDLGYSEDDYVGTHVGLGMIYTYNGDSYDQTEGGQIGFHDSIPAMGQIVLTGAKMIDDGMDNAVGVGPGESINGIGFGDGIEDNEYYTLEASFRFARALMYSHDDGLMSVDRFYNALQGLAMDGTPQLYGAVGPYAALGQSDPEFYATGGIPHTNNYSELSVNNAPGDRRILSGSGPGVLKTGDTLNYLTAHVLSFGIQNDPNGPSVGQLFTDAAKIKSYFANNDLGCGKTFDLSNVSLSLKKTEKPDFAVYPNPFKDELFIRHDFQGDVQLRIRNLNGQEIYHQDAVSNQQYISIDLTSGVYFVELNSSKGTVVKKIVRR